MLRRNDATLERRAAHTPLKLLLPAPQGQNMHDQRFPGLPDKKPTAAKRKRRQSVFERRVRVHMRRNPLPPEQVSAKTTGTRPAGNGGRGGIRWESLLGSVEP